MREQALFRQGQHVATKCGKGGETSTKANHPEVPVGGGHPAALVGKANEQAKKKTGEDIDCECTPRKR